MPYKITPGKKTVQYKQSNKQRVGGSTPSAHTKRQKPVIYEVTGFPLLKVLLSVIDCQTFVVI